jgi:phosphate transport system substrate-binding protein
MKKLFVVAIAAVLSGCESKEEKKESSENKKNEIAITMKGSDTVLPLGQKNAEEFMKVDSLTSITVVGGGSGVGIESLAEGTTDIAMSSRDLKTEEKLRLSEKKLNIAETVIAYDALSIIVHPENPVKQLTREQIEAIYTGAITNWKDVGGNNDKIVAYSRESSSGTYEFFKDHVLGKKNYSPASLSLPATGAIVQSVSQTRGAIGYIGLAYQTKEVNMLAVSYDKGKTYVAPGIQAALDKSYPISRPLYLLYDKASESKVKAFIDFCLSAKGQEIVEKTGYVPVRK